MKKLLIGCSIGLLALVLGASFGPTILPSNWYASGTTNSYVIGGFTADNGAITNAFKAATYSQGSTPILTAGQHLTNIADIGSSTAVAQVLSGTNAEFIGATIANHAVITNGMTVNTNTLYVTNNAVGIGTVAPTHFFHIVTATNDAVAIDSTGTDSNSMLHILNTGVQGPFFDFHAANDRYGFGVGSGGAFDIRHSATATDPVNGTNVLTLDSASVLTTLTADLTTANIGTLNVTNANTAGWTNWAGIFTGDTTKFLNGSGALTSVTGGTTNMMVSTISCASATLSPTFAVDGLSTTAASCRRLTMRCTMTNNVTTVSAVAGTLIDGDTMVWELIQDGTGSRTIAGWDTSYGFGTDITGITLTTTASARDFITFTYNSTATKWYCVGFVRGY